MASLGTLTDVLRLLYSASDHIIRKRLAAGLVFVFLGGALSALAPLALKDLVDAVAGMNTVPAQTPTTSPFALGAIYLAAHCSGRLLAEIRPLINGAAEQRLYARLSARFFSHLLELPLAFHLARRTGALIQSLYQAMTACQLILASTIGSTVPVLVEVVTVTIVLVHLGQPALVATFVLTALAYAIVFATGTVQLRKRARAVSTAAMDKHATLADSLLNYEAIKCFNAEWLARERLASATAEHETRWSALHRQRVRIGVAATTIFAMSLAMSLLLAGDAVSRGTLTIGGFVLANAYMLQIVRPLEVLGAAARDVSQALEFIRPFLDVLNEPTEMKSSALKQTQAPGACATAPILGARWPLAPPLPAAPRITFRDVHFAYDVQRPVLKGLDFEIPGGSSLAIVGASGCGKSSLVRLLLRLCEPDRGRILVGGIATSSLGADELRAMIGLVPQDTVLFNDTIASNIGIGDPLARRAEIEYAARLAQLHDFIASLPAGYDTRVGERGLKLSGGERQRVAIARAVLKRPQIYVFDEATSMLDSQTEASIMQSLREICAGSTTITIAHRLSTVVHADEILVLDDGQVAERGNHTTLLSSNGLYSRLWRTQMHGDIGRSR